MELEEIIKNRRSIRRFDPAKPVTKDQVKKILEAAIWAPSAGNRQPWHFKIVWNSDIKKGLEEAAYGQQFVSQAPVAIVVCADSKRSEERYGERGRKLYVIQDTAAAIQNMLLTITGMGLAACWVGAFDEEEAARYLKLKEDLRPIAIIPIGHGAESRTPPPRRPIKDVSEEIG